MGVILHNTRKWSTVLSAMHRTSHYVQRVQGVKFWMMQLCFFVHLSRTGLTTVSRVTSTIGRRAQWIWSIRWQDAVIWRMLIAIVTPPCSRKVTMCSSVSRNLQFSSSIIIWVLAAYAMFSLSCACWICSCCDVQMYFPHYIIPTQRCLLSISSI